MEQDATALTMTVREAAKLLGIGRNLTYESVKRGEIPSIRIGEDRVPRSGVRATLDAGWVSAGDYR